MNNRTAGNPAIHSGSCDRSPGTPRFAQARSLDREYPDMLLAFLAKRLNSLNSSGTPSGRN